MDERKTTIHEAGHAVAHIRLFPEMLRGELSIVPNADENEAGYQRELEEFSLPWTEEETPEQRSAFEKRALYCCAGYAAVRAAGYAEDEANAGCWSDFESAGKASEQPLETVKQAALEYMSRAENIKAVARIADELFEQKTLSPEVYEALIEVADGTFTEEEYQRFLALMRYKGTSYDH